MKKPPSTPKSFLESLKNPLNRFMIIGVLMGTIVTLPISAHAEDKNGEKKISQTVETINKKKVESNKEMRAYLNFLIKGETAPYPMCLRKSYGRTCALADNSDNSPKKPTQG